MNEIELNEGVTLLAHGGRMSAGCATLPAGSAAPNTGRRGTSWTSIYISFFVHGATCVRGLLSSLVYFLVTSLQGSLLT